MEYSNSAIDLFISAASQIYNSFIIKDVFSYTNININLTYLKLVSYVVNC